MTKVQSIFFILTILTSSCSYKVITMTDTEGKEHQIRVYDNYQDQVKYNDVSLFNYQYKQQSYSRYSGSISFITVDNFPYVQIDSVRVGFGPQARQSMAIFSSGILNSQIIYCHEDSSCLPHQGKIVTDVKTGKRIKPHIGNWFGNIINVGEISEPEYLKVSSQCRRFKLWINTVYGGHGYSVYFIELTNNTVDKYADIDEFVKNASLTFLTSYCCEI